MKDLFDLFSSGEQEEQKEYLKTSSSMEELLYDMIKKYHVDLSKDEQHVLCVELNRKLKSFQYSIFNIKDCRDLIFKEWAKRNNIEAYVPMSLAKLSALYNSSVYFLNQKLAKEINILLTNAKSAFAKGEDNQGVNFLLQANLSTAIYYTKEVFEILENNKESTWADAALKLKKQIQKIREMLVRGVLKAIAEIVSSKVEGIRINKGFGSPSITTLSFADVVQEGIILAMDKTLTYNIDNKAKWSSYIYGWVKRDLSHFITENTRTVQIPRTTSDRLRPLSKAISMIGDSNYKDIALLANKINAEQKERSVGRKLRSNELYTIEEVERLLPILQNTSEMSLDMTITDSDDGNREVTITDLIGVSEDPIYNAVDIKIVNRKLREVLSNMMSNECWEVLKIRWGLDDGVSRGLEETAKIYKNRYPKEKMNKGKVKLIESKVFDLLKKNDSQILKELHEASEAIIDRRSDHAVYTGSR